MKQTALDIVHPVVQASYFAIVLVLVMAAFQPVLIVIALVAGLGYSAYVRGWRATCKSLVWQLPLVVLIAACNPLFSAAGSTELFRFGLRVVYAESVAYGACMGMLLIAVITWFSNAAHVLSSDKVMALMGNVAPTIALMLSMAARLVPRFVRRGTEISAVQKACSGARYQGKQPRGVAAMRLCSVLMSWSMEDSLETADAMRARGWGATRKRTVYSRYRFRAFDGVALGVVLSLGVMCAALAWVACTQFSFYPRMSTLVVWWGYVPYGVFLCLPLLVQAGQEVVWAYQRSR